MRRNYPHPKQESTSSIKTLKSSFACCGAGIYLDYAATTPLDPRVLEAMLPYLKENFGNPSSIHNLGQEARVAIDNARERVADFLNCSSSEVIFTGSATEANNLAIFGVVRNQKSKNLRQANGGGQSRTIKNQRIHIITSQIEHHAVLEPCEALEKEGVEVTYLPAGKEGVVSVSDVEKAIKENTVLVSIMYANNEIGTIQPIAEIGNWLKLKAKDKKSKVVFHTDAVQAANYLDCDVKKLGVDLLTLSGHKIYGPKGVGALYIKQGTPIEPLVYGGGQEGGIRSGTENVAAIVGFGAAVAEIKNQKSKIKNIERLKDKLVEGILKKIPRSRLNGSRTKRLPNSVNISFEGVEGESIVIALDQEGVFASTGSACSSHSLKPSHVLLALGLTSAEAHGSLRLTLGRYTSEKDIDRVLEILPKIIQRLRKISPF